MRYDHPNCIVRRESNHQTTAGNGAISARFASFQKARLKAVHCQIVTAGTSAGAGNSLVIKKGATALGTFTCGTSTAGTKLTALTGLNTELASGDVLSATNGTDATGVSLLQYEYEVLPDAAQSA